MKKCIFCGNKFEKLAEEHIIPNVACGRFKSKNLICQDCNSWLGQEIDNALDGVYSTIISLFAIKRERGTSNPAIAKSISDNKVYNFLSDGTYELADTYFEINESDLGQIEIKMEGPVNKKFVKNRLAKFIVENKEKFTEKNVNYKELIKQWHDNIDKNWAEISSKTVPFKPNLLKFENNFGGVNILLAILKILYFALKELEPQIQFDENAILNILKNKLDSVKERCFYYSLKDDIFDEIENEISHFICIIGDSLNKKIIGYIKLFSITPYICILDENYEGVDFETSYGYKLLSQEQFVPIYHKLTNLDNLKKHLDYKTNFETTSEKIKKDYSRIMDLYYKKNPQSKWSEIQHCVYKKICELLGEDTADTPFFQSGIETIAKCGNYRFTEGISDNFKNEIITNLALILIRAAIYEMSRNQNN